MKIKGIVFGRGGTNDQRVIPGIAGSKSEIYVGYESTDSFGRGQRKITSIEFEPRGGLIIVKAVDQEGKPKRCWSQNENVKEHHNADYIAFRLADNMTMFCDEEPQAQLPSCAQCGKFSGGMQFCPACASGQGTATAAQNAPSQSSPAMNVARDDLQARQAQDPPPAQPIGKPRR